MDKPAVAPGVDDKREYSVQLSKLSNAMALYQYRTGEPSGDLFGKFYEAVIAQWNALGIEPTFIGLDGHGHTGKLAPFNGRVHQRAIRNGFADATVLQIVANPPGSDAPAIDGFADASLSYIDTRGELLLCVSFNDHFISTTSPRYRWLLSHYAGFCEWDFGYAFSSLATKRPDFHLLGISDGTLTVDEQAMLDAWYNASNETRKTILRDVYIYNILNEHQLQQTLLDGSTLEQYARIQANCTLEPIGNYGLHLWHVVDANVIHIRKDLLESHLLVVP